MIHSRVTSNAFRSIGYDEESRTLELQYHNGRRYKLENVPKELHYKLVNADSVGNFFNVNLRGNFKTTELNPCRSTKNEYEEPGE